MILWSIGAIWRVEDAAMVINCKIQPSVSRRCSLTCPCPCKNYGRLWHKMYIFTVRHKHLFTTLSGIVKLLQRRIRHRARVSNLLTLHHSLL